VPRSGSAARTGGITDPSAYASPSIFLLRDPYSLSPCSFSSLPLRSPFCRRLPVPPMPITKFALAHSCLCLGRIRGTTAALVGPDALIKSGCPSLSLHLSLYSSVCRTRTL